MYGQQPLPDWLWLGGTELCVRGTPRRAVVHVSLGPCYQDAVGKSEYAFPDADYIGLEFEHELFLRPPDPFDYSLCRSAFRVFSNFAEAHLAEGRMIVIHSETAMSTGPSLVLLLLARLGEIPSQYFAAAREEFVRRYPFYEPEQPLARFMRRSWRTVTRRSETPRTLAARSADGCACCGGPVVAGHHTIGLE